MGIASELYILVNLSLENEINSLIFYIFIFFLNNKK